MSCKAALAFVLLVMSFICSQASPAWYGYNSHRYLPYATSYSNRYDDYSLPLARNYYGYPASYHGYNGYDHGW
ncbi:hypothetical protein ABEB36_000663 [Hypothenemus hampei]|uniref:Uncharacterized protein n=1 Tax=Hypothenemus hampei TaxID=57062 RepID=A0ABD1FC00_HYPHA